MKKVTFLLVALTMLMSAGVKAQNTQECIKKYGLFKGDYQAKKYDKAYPILQSLMADCPSLSVNIYIYGEKLANKKLEAGGNKDEFVALIKKIYAQRLQYFPNKDVARAHSDHASFLADNNLASDDEIFAILKKAYESDPTRMGVKNIYRYFQGVTDRNKESNPQVVFDTYDDVLESVGEKLDYYSKKLAPLNVKLEKGEALNKREKNNVRAYTVNSKALGQVEAGLDNIIVELSTCENLQKIYTRDFEANKTNAKWLSRAVARMFTKECTDDPLYEKLVEAWVAADPSPKTTVYYAGILYKKGKETEAMEYYKKAVDQESDPFKKAENLYKVAQLFAKKGQKSQARSYATRALSFKPSMGKAYLLIASLYASSADQCGSNEFEKRMVYTAALRKVRRAVAVDPSISARASKYIKNYLSQEPSKKLIFTLGLKAGTPHTIKCWINETVKVPQK
ncbi:MAG: hypothetical protein HWD85_10410 [Flavobacteriaceae bacterium]|nr:hypothetical protein [Flavobacteriaceae bacterium]